MNADFLYMAVGVVISILSDLVPGYSTWYAGLQKNAKRWVMIGWLFLICLVVLLLNCWSFSADLISKYAAVECSEAGILDLLEAFFYAAVGNQAAFLLAPKVSRQSRTTKGRA